MNYLPSISSQGSGGVLAPKPSATLGRLDTFLGKGCTSVDPQDQDRFASGMEKAVCFPPQDTSWGGRIM